MKGWGQIGCGCFWMKTECRIPILFIQIFDQRFPYTTLQYTDNYIFLHTYKEVHAVHMCVLAFGYLTLCKVVSIC